MTDFRHLITPTIRFFATRRIQAGKLILYVLVMIFCTIELSHASTHTPLRLWYEQPAKVWTEALPIGNGSLGAMVFGGVTEERIQFNHDTLWQGGVHRYHQEGASTYLAEIRQLLQSGNQKQAEALAMEHFMSVPLRLPKYQPFADLVLKCETTGEVKNYERELDLENAIAKVFYTSGETEFTREVFSSFPDQALIQEISSKTPGRVSFSLSITSLHPEHRVQVIDGDQLLITGKVDKGETHFAARVRVVSEGGEISSDENGVFVRGANRATLYLVAATSFVDFQDTSGDPVVETESALETVSQKSFDALKARHVSDYQSLFQRVTMDLGSNESALKATDVRLMQSNEEKRHDTQLVTLLFQYGRYLLISSSRPGSQPANLQGIWNQQLDPSWGSKYTTNINAEMNYWPVEVSNLSELAEPMFQLVEEVAVTGRDTAREHYDANGWVLHHNTDLWRATAPINHSNHGIWPTGGAWLCQLFWEHYQYTLDDSFLRERAYPLMKGAALFFVDYLVEDETTSWLISGPSNSPEQGGLVLGPTMDHQIIRSLFAWVGAAANILGTDAAFAEQLQGLSAKIAPNQIGKHGQLQEWLEDIDDPLNQHRHVSHLWGVYPGNEITWNAPELMQAARKSLELRGDGGTSWSLAWKIALWTRFLDGERAHRLLMNQFNLVRDDPDAVTLKGPGGSYPNLFGAHPPFQIDSNFGSVAAITEMLVQSHSGEIVVLPALPEAMAARGSVCGLRVRGGAEVDLFWENGLLKHFKVISRTEKRIRLRLRYKDHTTELALDPMESMILGPDMKHPGPL